MKVLNVSFTLLLPSLLPSSLFFLPHPLIIHLCLQYVSSLAPQLLCSIDLDPRLSALGIFMSKMVHSTQAANSGEHSLFICVSSQTLLISRIVYNYKSIRLPEFPMNILLYSIGCIMINYFFLIKSAFSQWWRSKSLGVSICIKRKTQSMQVQ